MVKKAQITGQVFVYVFAMIVAAGILYFGYQGVQKILKAGDDAAYVQFTRTLSQDINRAGDFGSEQPNKAYKLPAQYSEICFAEIDEIRLNGDTINSHLNDVGNKALIKDSIQSEAKKNVFLWPKGEKSFYVEKLTVKEIENQGENYRIAKKDFLCFKALKSKVMINMIGCGDSTLITNIIPPEDKIERTVLCEP